jgi:soluble lytic murein transglycosylase
MWEGCWLNRLRTGLVLLVCAFAGTTQAISGPVELARQRARFLEAEAALEQHHYGRFHRLLKGMEGYPLYPYLMYADLERRLPAAPASQVQAFLDAYADTPLAPRLHRHWLKRLAQSKRWEAFLEAYQPLGSTTLECRRLEALIETGRKDEALDQVESLWLVGRSQPRVCDYAFKDWIAAGRLSTELAWERVNLAMEAGQIRLARYLSRFLAPKERSWLELWIRVHNKPMLVADPDTVKGHHPAAEAILSHGLRRWARSDPKAAAETWAKIRQERPFSSHERDRIERRIALSLAAEGHPDALEYLTTFQPAQPDETVDAWRARAALDQGDWRAVHQAIQAMTPEQRAEKRWRYWLARSLEERGLGPEARKIYAELAENRNYFGFLAADRLDRPYAFEHRPLALPNSEVDSLVQRPAFRRAHELLLLGRTVEARREWHHATEKADEADLLRAAALAHQWGWHDRAILTVARTSHFDDLELRFPLPYRDNVFAQAALQNIDPAWVFAVMRQESAFTSDVRSRAGALGLMQIMPATGRQIARTLNTPWRSSHQLLKTNTNIRFGTAYLRRMMDKLEDHPVLATAAYNAGSQRVSRWLPENRAESADLWVETIPFGETRSYVSRVFAYTAIYEQRLGRKITRLGQRMPPIEAFTASVSRDELRISGKDHKS